MLIRYQDLVNLDLVATDGSKHRVEDVYFDDKALRVLYVVVDIGGWFDERKAVVSIDRCEEPNVGASEWPCALDEAALAEKPQPETLAPEGGRTLPDAMLFPAGSRISPRLLHRSLGDEHLPIPAHADPKGRIREGAHLRSCGEWILDTDVHASDGPAGKLMGIIFEGDDWTARYLVVETGGEGMPKNQRVIEAGRIAAMDFDARTVTLDLPNEDVQKALDLHEIDGLESKWYNRVLAYYGLQS